MVTLDKDSTIRINIKISINEIVRIEMLNKINYN